VTGRVRVLIVDDEPLARRGVRARLARYDNVEIAGECDTGAAAVRAIRSLAPDVVFLDVQMPELDGFGVVEEVGAGAMPVTVFLTAFDQHALRAFEARALDYLLKPIDDERFSAAMDRAIDAVMQRRVTGGVAPIRITARDRGRVLLLDVMEVDWVEAQGDYVRLHAGRKTHLVRDTLTRFAGKLPPDRFVRIHRSAVVNVDRVRELLPKPNREWIVVLIDGTRLRLSRGYRDEVERLLPKDLRPSD